MWHYSLESSSAGNLKLVQVTHNKALIVLGGRRQRKAAEKYSSITESFLGLYHHYSSRHMGDMDVYPFSTSAFVIEPTYAGIKIFSSLPEEIKGLNPTIIENALQK